MNAKKWKNMNAKKWDRIKIISHTILGLGIQIFEDNRRIKNREMKILKMIL